MKKFLILSVLAVVTGCSATSSLQRSLEDTKGSLIYVYDSEKIGNKKAGSITIGAFSVEDVLAPETTVKRKSTFFLPLLFFNIWKQEDQAYLGYMQLKNDYKQFFRESLVEEIRRSSEYSLREEQGDLTLDVKIKKIEMSAPINQDGHFIFAFFFVAWGTRMSAGPVDINVAADVQANKSGSVVLTREITGNFRTSILAGKDANLRDYTTAMIEGLSMAVKDLNEKIVKEINAI